ncbi:hypothetical protein DYBT9275_04176 [Dyadobacter sp. CECT 9275]|uniref:Uncharacterized protein n=1 Tax=Dyadobacter helix TaxID=2822344 RepID=A0A916JER9_9BACT|nr:hypothetical protein [Dyadobacter sp. CECT 9275]CAG5008015.1 hypothetical protein DYBT9275_04176 [Dyadobacter sp. CECT 9275]
MIQKIQLTLFTLVILTALVISFFVLRNQRMKSVWTAPYFSAAENLSFGGDFLMDQNDIIAFDLLDNRTKEDHYVFKKSDHLTHYNYNPIGYAYLIYLARIIFPFAGHQLAIILFQGLTFVILAILILSELETSRKRYLFLFLFALNPLIIRFVVFNLYYFWQILVSGLILLIYYNFRPRTYLLPLILLPFIIITRPTTITLLPLLFLVCYQKLSFTKLAGITAYCLVIVLLCYKPTEKNIWHSAYAGIGAYPNPYNVHLSDNDAYALFDKKMGYKLSASLGGNYYDKATIQIYQRITRDEVLRLLRINPWLFIKNAVLNTFQSFGLGYLNRWPVWINYFSAFLGFVYALTLLLRKQYFIIAGIILGSISFTPYYPPIPAYMYGNYAFIIAGILLILNRSLPLVKFRKSSVS